MDRLSTAKKQQILSANALFSELNSSDIDHLVGITESRIFKAQSIIVEQGTLGNEMFIIARGTVIVQLHLAEEEDITIGELVAGEAFGEIALFDQLPRTATVACKERCELLVLYREAFNAFLIKHPLVAIQLLSVMAKRLRKTNDLLKDSMYSEVTAKLAYTLRNIANAYGKNTHKGLQIDALFNDDELGEIAGVPPEVVTAQLRHWRKEGVINISHGYLTLVKPEVLEQID